MTEEHRLKIQAALKKGFAEGKYKSNFTGRKPTHWIGRKHKDETKEKISVALTENNGMKRKEVVEKFKNTITDRKTNVKSNNPNWKGGVTKENVLTRKSRKYKAWRTSVFERDDYTCQTCFSKGVHLHAHHIKSFSEHPEYRLDIDNGITLCRPCHKELHNDKKEA